MHQRTAYSDSRPEAKIFVSSLGHELPALTFQQPSRGEVQLAVQPEEKLRSLRRAAGYGFGTRQIGDRLFFAGEAHIEIVPPITIHAIL